MSITILLVLIIVLAFLIGGVIERRLPQVVSRSGIEYALLGVLLGSELGFEVLSPRELSLLDPFLQMVLGLVGFILGLRSRDLFSSPGIAVASAVGGIGCYLSLATLIALVLMNSAIFETADSLAETVLVEKSLGVFFGNRFELTLTKEQLQLSLGVAAAATVSSLGVGTSSSHNEGTLSRFLKSSASASQIVGIVALGLVLAGSRALDGANRFSMTIVEWSIATVVLGLCCGVLFGLFIGREQERIKIFLATVGLVTFATGIGVALGVSPMFINLLAGITVAGLSSHAATLRQELRRLERPLRIIVMVFLGALWIAPELEWWLFALALFYARWWLKRLWTLISNHWVLRRPIKLRRLGDGMLSQGAVAAAVGASFAQQQPETQRAWILTAVLVVALLSDWISEDRWRALLYSAGESDDTGAHAPRSSEL